MFPPKTFDEYFNIAKELLTPGKADKSWINHINQMFKEKNLKQSLTNMYHINCSVAYLKQILSLAIISSVEEVTSQDIIKVIHLSLNDLYLAIDTVFHLIRIFKMALKLLQTTFFGSVNISKHEQ